jgi:hypothetical protein
MLRDVFQTFSAHDALLTAADLCMPLNHLKVSFPAHFFSFTFFPRKSQLQQFHDPGAFPEATT